MTKKVRRVRRTRAEDGIPQSTPAASKRRPSLRMARKQAEEVDLQEEYAYVIKDLRRIFVLAVIMFVVLIVANIAFQTVG
jgi:hypothetical protein